MIKQPKYFISKDRTLKSPVSTRVPDVVLEPPVGQSGPDDTTVAPRKTHAILLGLSVLSLVLLTSLGLLSRANAQKGTIPLPSFLPTRQETTAVVTSDTGTTSTTGLSFDVKVADARVEIVRAFLARHNSPLTPHDHYAKELVSAADRYGLDYRLLPAIMMQESNLCKMSKPELKNCFGFGIHKNGELGFDSYEASFDRVARELRARYIDIGLTTPEQIETKYTPSSNGSWSASVNQWIAEMEHNDRQAGKDNENDANLLEYVEKQ